ncbi:MAG TPA: histidine kinase [Chryseosolibacter sp.]
MKSFSANLPAILIHALSWSLIFYLPIQSTAPAFSPFRAEVVAPKLAHPTDQIIHTMPLDSAVIKKEIIGSYVFLMIFFYLNWFILVPRLLTHKKVLYGVSIAGCFVAFIVFSYVLRSQLINSELPFGPPVLFQVPHFIMVFGLSLAFKLIQDRNELNRVLKEQETQKLLAELSFLRFQVSPHFIFNVLNSLASLSRKNSSQIEPSIIQLSNLMRYTLYNRDEKVTLENEVDYIRNFISLQKLRFQNNISIELKTSIEDDTLLIEPMLLITFVENAFKHGTGKIKDPVIRITISSTLASLTFQVVNRFNPKGNQSLDPSSGIGLQNLVRRLDLLYNEQYELILDTTDGWYTSTLKINLR